MKNKIKILKEQSGLSVYKLSEMTGLPHQTLYNIMKKDEVNIDTMKYGVLRPIAEAFGVNVEGLR